MSKESMAGQVCRCGVPIYYQEQHREHCPEKTSWQTKTKVKEEKRGGSKGRQRRGVKRSEGAPDVRERNEIRGGTQWPGLKVSKMRDMT